MKCPILGLREVQVSLESNGLFKDGGLHRHIISAQHYKQHTENICFSHHLIFLVYHS